MATLDEDHECVEFGVAVDTDPALIDVQAVSAADSEIAKSSETEDSAAEAQIIAAGKLVDMEIATALALFDFSEIEYPNENEIEADGTEVLVHPTRFKPHPCVTYAAVLVVSFMSFELLYWCIFHEDVSFSFRSRCFYRKFLAIFGGTGRPSNDRA